MPQISLDAKIFVAGHRGLVGSAIVRFLESKGYRHLLKRTREELDLTSQEHVRAFFEKEKPEFVFLAAAKVGGIYANNRYPAQFYYQNVAIQMNVIHASYQCGVNRLLFMGSSCIYPRESPQPIREPYLLSGPLEPTNRAYAVAKISGIEMCRSYNQEYGTHYLAVLPTNLYGPGDNYHPENSHVIPGLLKKMHEAKRSNSPTVSLWGSGRPKREFLYSDDLAEACVFIMNLPDAEFKALLAQPLPVINIGCGTDLSISELAELIKEVVGYSGRIVWDLSMHDGMPRKLLDVSRMNQLGWSPKIELRDGLTLTYRDFSHVEEKK